MTDPYIPLPVDTSDVTLPPELTALTERMAENAHDVWAKNRMDQGWTYGPERDDAQRKHPCLVAYRELPEQEKEYDRVLALETLRLILKLGFDITPSGGLRGERQ